MQAAIATSTPAFANSSRAYQVQIRRYQDETIDRFLVRHCRDIQADTLARHRGEPAHYPGREDLVDLGLRQRHTFLGSVGRRSNWNIPPLRDRNTAVHGSGRTT